MAKKTQDIKRYLDSIGKTEHLHVFVGNTTSIIENSTTDANLQLWRDSVFSKKISKVDVVGVIPNISWSYGNVYNPWKSSQVNSGSYYAWNRENGNVYLCIQNNTLSREDLSGLNASTYSPNHAYGIQSYPDGYSWLPIYRITGDLLRFVKNDWIPVISFENFEENTYTTEYTAINDFCSGDIGASGSCAIYFKENTQLPSSGISFQQYLKGDRYVTITSDCSECYNLFSNNEKYKSIFYGQKAVNDSIIIEDKFDLIGRLISENKIPASSAYYSLYEIANNGPDDGAIISAQIDLNGISGDDLIVFAENPSITVESSTGIGGQLSFKTFTDINGTFIIQGIEVTNGGSNYRDISLDISSGIFKNSSIKDILLSAIKINFDNLDGLNIDPYDVLECNNIMVDSRIDTNELVSSNVILPEEINMFGLVSNPLEETSNGEYVISGSELSPYASKIVKASSDLLIHYPGDEVLSYVTVSPSLGLSTSTTSTGIITKKSNILAIDPDNLIIPKLTYQSVINIVGIDYSNIEVSDELTDSNDNTFIIDSVYSKPKFVQYSGKVLQSVKTSKNIKLTSSNSQSTKIIRINFIKGI